MKNKLRKLISIMLVLSIIATAFVSAGSFGASASGTQMATFAGTTSWCRIMYAHNYDSSNVFEVGKYRFIMDCVITNGVMPVVMIGDGGDARMNPVKNDSGTEITVNYVHNYDEVNRKYTVEFEVTECFTCGGHPIGLIIGDWTDGSLSAFSFANPALYALDSNGNITGSSKINAFTSDNIYTTAYSRNGKWRKAGSGFTVEDYNASVFAPATPQMITFTGEDAWTRITYAHNYDSSNVFKVGKYRFIMDCVITNGVMPDVFIGNPDTTNCNPFQNSSGEDIMVNYVYNYDAINRKFTVDFEVTEQFACGSKPIGVIIGDWRSGGASAFSCANPALYALDSNGDITGNSKINPFTANNLYTTKLSHNGKWRDAGTGYFIKDYDETVFAPIDENELNTYVMQLSGKKEQNVYQIVPLSDLVYGSTYKFSIDVLTRRLGTDTDPRIRVYSAIGAGGAYREETLTRVENTNTYTATYIQQFGGNGDGFKLWIGTLNDEDDIIVGNPKLYKLDSEGEKTGTNLISDPGFSTGVSNADESTEENPWFSEGTATKVTFPTQTSGYFAYDPNEDYDPNAPQMALLHNKASMYLLQEVESSNFENGAQYKFSVDVINVRQGASGGAVINVSTYSDGASDWVPQSLVRQTGTNNYSCTYTHESGKATDTAFKLEIYTRDVEDYCIIGNPKLYKLDLGGNEIGDNLISDPYFHTGFSSGAFSSSIRPWYTTNDNIKNSANCEFVNIPDNYFNEDQLSANMLRVESKGNEYISYDTYFAPSKTYKITYNRKCFGAEDNVGNISFKYKNSSEFIEIPSGNVSVSNSGYKTTAIVTMPSDAITDTANLKMMFAFGESEGNTVYIANVDIRELDISGNPTGNNLCVNGGFYGTQHSVDTAGSDERTSVTGVMWSYKLNGTFASVDVVNLPNNFFSETGSTPKKALKVTGNSWSCVRNSLHLESNTKYQLSYKYKYDTHASRISMQQINSCNDFSALAFTSADDTNEFLRSHTFTTGSELSSNLNYIVRFWIAENDITSEAYWYDIELYELDSNDKKIGKNLLDNGDFAIGNTGAVKSLYGWEIEGVPFESVELVDVPENYFDYCSPADSTIYLINHLLGKSQAIIYITLDRNKDNNIDIVDLVLLKKYYADADGEDSSSDVPSDWYTDTSIRMSMSELSQILSMDFVKPKNVIMMIGDGMGANDIRLATENSPNVYDFGLILNQIENTGYATTRSNNSSVTDSAAGGTALATGYKTDNGMIGVSSTGEILKNLSEYAREVGKKVGVVTNDSLTGATPADFLVHVDSRGSTSDIASQMVSFAPDVIIGQGFGDFEKFDLSNFVLAKDFSEFRTVLNSGNRQADKNFMGFINYNATYSNEINILSHCTEVALNCLSKNNDDGFFLMVENTTTDNAGHANNVNAKINGVVALDRSVAAVLKFMKNNPDTLLIITSDHETGGVTIPSGSYSLDSSLFTTTKHTNANVRTFAVGYGAEYFKNTTVDNTDVANFAINAIKGIN